MVGVGEGGLIIEEDAWRKVPVYWGDPLKLSIDELEQCRLTKWFSSTGTLRTKINNAITSYYYQAINHQTGESIYGSGDNAAKSLKAPFVMKWPEDFDKFVNEDRTRDDVEREIIEGFSDGLEVISKHRMVRDWDRVTFNPQLDNVRIECRDGNIVSGENVLAHEREHAKKYHELTDKSAYIVVGLRVESDDEGGSYMKVEAGYMGYSESVVERDVQVETVLAPMFPSGGDYKIALENDLYGSLELIKNKPWWGLLETTVKERLKHASRLESWYILSDISEEFNRLVEKQARHSDGYNKRPKIVGLGVNYIDESKIKRIYTES